MTIGNGGGWGDPGSGSDWEDWTSPPDPTTSEFDRITWSDTTASPPPGSGSEWHDRDDRLQWTQPTEQQPGRSRWPVVLGTVLGVAILAAAGLVGFLLMGEDDGQQTIEAVATTSSSAPGWSTSAQPTTSAPEAEPVVPAAGRSSRSSCTKADIARDLGTGPVSYVDCFGDWAVVSWAAGSGDGGVVRLVNGVWTPTNYGPSACNPESIRGIVPRELIAKHLYICSEKSSTSRSTSTARRTTTRTSTSIERRTETVTSTTMVPVPVQPVEATQVPTTAEAPTQALTPTTEATYTANAVDDPAG